MLRPRVSGMRVERGRCVPYFKTVSGNATGSKRATNRQPPSTEDWRSSRVRVEPLRSAQGTWAVPSVKEEADAVNQIQMHLLLQVRAHKFNAPTMSSREQQRVASELNCDDRTNRHATSAPKPEAAVQGHWDEQDASLSEDQCACSALHCS